MVSATPVPKVPVAKAASPAPRAATFTRTHQTVHWLTAALMLAVLICAWWMIEIDHSVLRGRLLSLHKSMGLTIFALTLFRVVWGLTHPAAPLPGRVALVERVLAHLTHLCLYILMIAMPLSGYMSSIWGSAPVSYFGLFTIPAGVEPNDDLADQAFNLHYLGQWAVYGFIGFHFLGALYHWLIRRDGVAARMGRGSSAGASGSASRY